MRAILHIGFPKTGTTTIQKHLEGNRDELGKQGFYLPKYHIIHPLMEELELEGAGHVPLFYLCSESHGKEIALSFLLKTAGLSRDEASREFLDSFWNRTRDEILEHKGNADTVIFSCEFLIFFLEDQVRRLREILSEMFEEITVVVYLRRQMESLISWYAEVNKIGGPFPTFETLLATQPGVSENYFFNYEMVLGIWAKYFGEENTKPRIFHRKEMIHNDLLDDFTQTVGIDNSVLTRFDSVNQSLPSDVTEFCRLLNKTYPLFTFGSPANLNRLITAKALVEKYAKPGNRAFHPGREQVREIIELYRDSNNAVAKKYLGKAQLFDEDVSNYPEKPAPHGLTPLRSTEIAAWLWEYALERKK